MTNEVKPGGGYLVAPVPQGGIFSKEKLSEEQWEIAEMTYQFFMNEVVPRKKEIEAKGTITENGKEVPIAVSLLRQVGEMGLLSVDVPEEYGGMAMDKTTSMLIAENCVGCMSIGCTFGAHNGIGTLPIVFFGSEEQKKKFLPGLASGEHMGCYALTEPEAGSDALSGKATATLNEAGTHYLINGEKQFITNGSWAKIGIVFANVKGKYSAFIVDMDSKGVSRGAEEKKLGILGSSTCNLIFEDAEVPKENLLGEIGDAASIALNMLNLGRMKLGFGALGTAKYVINLTLEFGKQRKQFGQPVITFGIQKRKLADMVARTFATDSMSYRTTGAIDEKIAQLPVNDDYFKNAIKLIRLFALEAAALKIAGSENLEEVVRHAIKMHGGYGFIEEYKVEAILRDNVIDHLYEGTNDINRLTMFDTFVRNIFGAKIPFREYMEQLDAAFRKNNLEVYAEKGPLSDEIARITAAKRLFAYTVHEGLIYTGKGIRTEQEFMEAAVDAMIAIYAMDSTVARVVDMIQQQGEKKSALPLAIARVITHDYTKKVIDCCSFIINGIVPEDNLPFVLDKYFELESYLDNPFNTMILKKFIADTVIEAGKYNL